jgi:hypothetical protein
MSGEPDGTPTRPVGTYVQSRPRKPWIQTRVVQVTGTSSPLGQELTEYHHFNIQADNGNVGTIYLSSQGQALAGTGMQLTAGQEQLFLDAAAHDFNFGGTAQDRVWIVASGRAPTQISDSV